MKRKQILLLIFWVLLCGTCIYFYQLYNVNQTIKTNINLIQDKLSEQPKLFSVILSGKEKEFLLNNLKTSKHYLEFGSGGSTFLALLNSDADIVSVENDKKWIEHLKSWKVIRENNNKRVHFYYANTGKIGGYGFPTDVDNDAHLFPNYSDVFKNINNEYFDLVFIDGRFRVACALQTILNTDKNVKIMIHDFTYRPYYNDILEFLSIEKTVDTMVLLKKKDNIDKNKVTEMYEKYKYDYR